MSVAAEKEIQQQIPPEVVEATEHDDTERFDDSFRSLEEYLWQSMPSAKKANALKAASTNEKSTIGSKDVATEKKTSSASTEDEKRKKVLGAMMHLAAQNAATSVQDGHSAARTVRELRKSFGSPAGMTRAQLFTAVGMAVLIVLALAISRTNMENWVSHSLANSTLFGLDVLYLWRGILVFVLASVLTDVGEAYLPLDGELAAKANVAKGSVTKRGITSVTQARKDV